MEKLKSILAIVNAGPLREVVLEKASSLAHASGASLAVIAGHMVPADIVARTRAQRPDLVVKAASDPHPLRRLTVGESDWTLARDCPVPLMLVRARPWRMPMRFAAAVDIADEAPLDLARAILHTAGFLTLDCGGELDVFYSEREEQDGRVRMTRAVRLAQMVREYHVGGEHIHHLDGAPEETLPERLAQRHYDCVVLGSLMRRGLASVLEGVTSRIADAVESDIVFVKRLETDARAERSRRAPHVTAAAAS